MVASERYHRKLHRIRIASQEARSRLCAFHAHTMILADAGDSLLSNHKISCMHV
jgi:hypothetical protein